jgi:predicted nuclease with TOPRIM domain
VAPVVAAAGAPTAAPNPDLDSLRNQVASLQAQLDAATKDAGARRHTAEIAAQDLAAAREAITQLRSENAQLSELKTLNDHEAQELERARRLTFTLNP